MVVCIEARLVDIVVDVPLQKVLARMGGHLGKNTYLDNGPDCSQAKAHLVLNQDGLVIGRYFDQPIPEDAGRNALEELISRRGLIRASKFRHGSEMFPPFREPWNESEAWRGDDEVA